METIPMTKTIHQWSEFYHKNDKLSYNYPEFALILGTIADALGSLNCDSSEELTICFTQGEIDIINANE